MKKRSYSQFCGVARALDVVGERWTLLILRDLMLGPLRYSELLRGLEGITTNLLAKRLKELEHAGIIERIRGASSESQAYRLTAHGAALEPALQALAQWGWEVTEQAPARGERRRFEWLLFALRARYRGGETMRVELVADGAPYRVILTPATAELSRGDVPGPQLRIRGAALDVARVLLQRTASRTAPGVELEGPTADLQRLRDAFDSSSLAFAQTAVTTA